MTLIAGIGSANALAEIRPGNSKAVISPWIHLHICALGHMTVDAIGAGLPALMKMVILAVVTFSLQGLEL